MGKKKKTKGLESKTEAARIVSFKVLAPEAQRVSLAGDFNNWGKDACLLKKNSKGIWKIKLDLMPGRYEYRFLVDGEWRNDPDCTNLASNPFGDENCILTLQ